MFRGQTDPRFHCKHVGHPGRDSPYWKRCLSLIGLFKLLKFPRKCTLLILGLGLAKYGDSPKHQVPLDNRIIFLTWTCVPCEIVTDINTLYLHIFQIEVHQELYPGDKTLFRYDF